MGGKNFCRPLTPYDVHYYDRWIDHYVLAPCKACNGSGYADYAAVPCDECGGHQKVSTPLVKYIQRYEQRVHDLKHRIGLMWAFVIGSVVAGAIGWMFALTGGFPYDFTGASWVVYTTPSQSCIETAAVPDNCTY